MTFFKIKKIIFIHLGFFALSSLFSDTGFPLASDMQNLMKPRGFLDGGHLEYSKPVYPSKTDDEKTKIKKKEETQKFQKYENEIEQAFIDYRRDGTVILKSYTYTIKKEDLSKSRDFKNLASELGQSQATLSTANGIASVEDFAVGMTLILPVLQGMFVADSPKNDFEILVKKQFESFLLDESAEKKWIPVVLNGRNYKFLPEKLFTGTLVAFFNDKGMKLPLPQKVLTSPFGYRTSPISGKWKLHAGIDLAAPMGTPVTACKSGTVKTVENMNVVYGNYIVLDHGNGKTSTYAHLSKIDVRAGAKVSGGDKIGEVGTTGMSTGPHLHFEVRENGNPIDPLKELK